MDAVNVMPMTNPVSAGNQTKAQTSAEAGKTVKNTDAFTNVLNTAVDQKAMGEQAKDLQGNMTVAMNNLEAALAAALIKGLTNTSDGETQSTADVNKEAAQLADANTDGAVNPQMLAAIMALLGAQTPGFKNPPDEKADVGKNTDVAIAATAKMNDIQIPFAALQGKVLSSLPATEDTANTLNLPNTNTNDAAAANNILLQNTQLQPAETQNMSDMPAAKLQIVSQAAGMPIIKPIQVKQAEQKSTNAKNDITEKSTEAATLISGVQPQKESTLFPAADEAVSTQTNDTEQTLISNLLQAETKREHGGEVSTDQKEQQPVIFSNILAQNTEKSVHTAAQIVSPQEMPKAQDPYNVAGQIVDHAKLFRKPFDPNNSEMLIKLRPEHLGELTLKVAVDNGVVSASFHTNNSEVRSIIEASLPQLKQDMANQGIKVDNVDVYAGMGDLFSNGQQGELFRQQQEQQQKAAKLRNINVTEEFVQSVEEQSTPKVAGTDGVDYLV
jgi:flagellar hook-length control protein FliK